MKGKSETANELEKRLDSITDNNEYYNIIMEEGIADEGSTEWTEVKNFNLMFKTFVGPVEDSSAVVYLRPESPLSFEVLATKGRGR